MTKMIVANKKYTFLLDIYKYLIYYNIECY